MALLVVTTNGTILDGYVRWQVALEQGRPNLPCLEYDLTDAEALAFVIDRQRRSSHLNAFCRIALALELEDHFRQRNARGRRKAGATRSSNLTKRDRTDVRADIAGLADACPANVTNVKRILSRVIPEIREHLRRGEVSIHMALQWCETSARAQRDALWAHLNGSSQGSVQLWPVPWLISQTLSSTYVAGEHRLYLERNCRLSENPAHGTRRKSRGACQFQGAEQSARVRPSGKTSAKVQALDWKHLYGAMLGNLGFSVPIDIPGNPAPEDAEISSIFMSGGRMHRERAGVPVAPQNQTIDAILFLLPYRRG